MFTTTYLFSKYRKYYNIIEIFYILLKKPSPNVINKVFYIVIFVNIKMGDNSNSFVSLMQTMLFQSESKTLQLLSR